MGIAAGVTVQQMYMVGTISLGAIPPCQTFAGFFKILENQLGLSKSLGCMKPKLRSTMRFAW